MNYEYPEAPRTGHRGPGGVVGALDAGSPAQRAGLAVGDVIVSADGHELSDVLDWMWWADDAAVDLSLEDGRTVTVEREPGEAWGIEFADALFDGVRRCVNDCTFCFIHQLPADMRSSLNVRDDDYRLSFLQGNFVTLTNVSDADIARIVEQHLSPLHVSVHAVTPEVRERLIGRHHGIGLDRLDELVQAGIEVHTQIVLVPGVNDGPELDRTIEYLKDRRPGIVSVGIVPVAHTDHLSRRGVDGAPLTGAPQPSYAGQSASAQVIAQVQRHQFESREATELTWVHLADEFYIEANAPFPKEEWYDGFPQYENGIGMVVSFASDVRERFEALTAAVERIPEGSDALTVIVGELATGTVLGALSALRAGGRVRVLPVKNRFFGGNVSVTGLLTGTDIAQAIRYDAAHAEQPSTYVVPAIIFNVDRVTLDGYTEADLAREAAAPITFVEASAEGLLAGLAVAGRE